MVRTRELRALQTESARVRNDVHVESRVESRVDGEWKAGAADGHSDPDLELWDEVIREVIRLADGLVDLNSGLSAGTGSAGHRHDDHQVATVLRWVKARTASLLAACHIGRIEETGAFDPGRHQAVTCRPAPTPDLANQIAETIRPGYTGGPAGRGVVLRPQQVVLYVAADPASVAVTGRPDPNLDLNSQFWAIRSPDPEQKDRGL